MGLWIDEECRHECVCIRARMVSTGIRLVLKGGRSMTVHGIRQSIEAAYVSLTDPSFRSTRADGEIVTTSTHCLAEAMVVQR